MFERIISLENLLMWDCFNLKRGNKDVQFSDSIWKQLVSIEL